MNKEIDKLAWIYIQDGKLLNARSKGKNLFYIPGGKREAGETDEEALTREIKEEVSVDLQPDSIKYAESFVAAADGKDNETQVKLTCYFASYVGALSADAEIEEIKFIRYQDKTQCSAATIKVLEWLKTKKLVA